MSGAPGTPTAPETPPDSPLTMQQALAHPVYIDLSTPKLAVGDAAFAFELPLLDPETHVRTGGTFRLADHTGRRPVALVFGSYT